jgi:hypothetical protein
MNPDSLTQILCRVPKVIAVGKINPVATGSRE